MMWQQKSKKYYRQLRVAAYCRVSTNQKEQLISYEVQKKHYIHVCFEEQNLHSIDPSSEFYISIYGSVAQSESENISANAKWGKAQSAKDLEAETTENKSLATRDESAN